MKRRMLSLPVLVLLLIGCVAQPTATPAPPVYTPTATQEVTPVPLLLTPIVTPQPLPELPPMPDGRSSRSIDLYGDWLVTANIDSASVSLLDLADPDARIDVPVGDDPRTVSITPDGEQVWAALRGDNALAVVELRTRALAAVYEVCHMPYGVVTDDRRAYVSCFGEDALAVVDRATGDVLYSVAVPDAPAGLALSGEWLLVTHFYSGRVSMLNVRRSPFVLGTVDAEPDGNLAQSIVLAPDGRRAYLPLTRTGLALISLQYMQDWFPVVSALDVTAMQGRREERLTLSALDEAANMPFDAAFAPDGTLMLVVLAGSDALQIIDVAAQTGVVRIPVGRNPRGVVLAEDRAYVHNTLDGSISVIDTAAWQVVETLNVAAPDLSSELLLGKVLFHRAASPSLSDGSVSCATCHFDGGMDSRTWLNFRSGPRNTPALGGAAALPPYNWAGEMAELHDTIEDQIRNVMFGDGLIEGSFDPLASAEDTGRSGDLDALVAYVASLEPWPSPYREPDGALTDSARRGMQLFMSGSPGCSCHAPPLYTDLRAHNLAGVAFSLENYEAFDTPTLRGLWASAPYMHDGVAQTLEEVLTRTDPFHSVAASLTAQQLADLIAFLLSL